MEQLRKKYRQIMNIWRTTPETIHKSGVFIASFLAIFHVGFFLLVRHRSEYIFTNDILSVISGLAAVVGIAYGASWSYRFDRRLGIAWSLVFLAMVFWVLGDALWAYYELVLGEVSYPSIGDVSYLLAYPLFLIGILMIPRQGGNSTQAVWLWLDFFIVLFSAFGIYWNFLIGPAIIDPSNSRLAVLVNAAYPVGDLLLILAITVIIFLPRSPLWIKPLAYMLIGHGASAIADSIYLFQTINGTYDSGAIFNILFSIGPLALMLCGLSQAVAVRSAGAKKDVTISLYLNSGYLTLIRLVIPFFWLLIAYLMLNFNPTARQAFPPLYFSVWVITIIILLAVRQVLATLDNNRLSGELRVMNDNLEKRVAERSSDLITINAELRSEMEERKRVEIMLREREEKLAHFALHDALTGLPNRSLLSDRISQAIQHYKRSKEPYAVLFLDLDNFKFVNDSLGHVPGDQLLVQVGERLTAIVRAEDTIARLGGDEFIILLERFNNESYVTIVANRILASMSEPFTLVNQPIYVTASVGIVMANPDYQTPVEIIRDADLAMYKAKLDGKAHSVVFTPDLHHNAINRLALSLDLRQGLALDQFVLYYQPIIALESGRLKGFEALIRWQHPVRGLIGPSEFIPLIESSELMDSITKWTIQKTCQQLRKWHLSFPMDPPLQLSINFSTYSLRRPELYQWIHDSLTANSLSADCLEIEIVETAIIQDADLAKRVFTDLHALGVKISLDDFGIGYSSLGYINEYPINILKIDRSFISQVPSHQKVASVVRAIVTLAKELDIDVIAEGIETEEQFEFMKEAGCKYGQGFLFSKALPPQRIQSWYLKQKSR